MPFLFNAGTPNIVENIDVDQRTGEFHSASSQVTNFAVESGANKNDHVILDPETIELSFVIENVDTPQSDSLLLGSVISPGAAYGVRAATQFEKLKEAWRNREVFDVLTQHYLYKSMVIIDVSAENTSPFSGQLRGRVTFQSYSEINAQVVDVPASQLNGTAKQSASSQVDAGRKEGEQVSEGNVSTFAQLYDAATSFYGG